jgi:hypothetical protein
LVHCSLAILKGHSQLSSIACFAASFQFAHSEFVYKTPNASVLSNITWWRRQLSLPFTGSSLKKPPPTSSIEFWVDASAVWGIGVIFNGFWDAWKLQGNWKSNGRNIGWAEFVVVKLGILLAVSRTDSPTFISLFTQTTKGHLYYYKFRFILDSFLLRVCPTKFLRSPAANIDFYPWLNSF